MLNALSGYPGGRELLELAGARDDVALVGGAVRDLLLGHRPRELDVVVAQGAAELASALVLRLGNAAGADLDAGCESSYHERFGTAVVRWSGGQIDIATRRAESYRAPGALPEVRDGTIEDDLMRRDFTVNAIAIPLGGPERGELVYEGYALDDLAAAQLRVLHERSFIEDPTRLLRLARYSARLGFEVEPYTAELATAAIAAGALATISLARVGGELRLALGEADSLAALCELDRLGVLAALDPRLRFDPDLARCALSLLPEDGRPDLLLLATLMLAIAVDPDEDPEPAMFGLLHGFELTAAERQRVMDTALVASELGRELKIADLPSELHEAVRAHTIEAVALGGALADSASAAREWIEKLRHVRLEITGDDLLAAGIPTGPEIGARLSAVLARKLDGELPGGRDAELQAAIAVRR